MKDSRPEPARSPAPPADEGHLLARCRVGDTRAYRILVERYRDRAYGLALRILRSEPDAEEVAQDAFVRAWRAIADFRGDAAFGTWLFRIVWRRAIDRAATLRLRRGREAPLEDSVHVPAPDERGDAGGTGSAGQGEARDPGWERLTMGLSEAQRAAVTLFYYQDLSVADVARAMEMPEGTVKTHLSRARAALRAQYRKAEER